MPFLKKTFFKILGLKNYLRVLHRSFHFMYANGMLKKDIIYKYHYFDANLILPGDTVIDIGANLGYYTVLFAKWVGPSGKVYAVEPVKPFADTIRWATGRYPQITLLNYALGEEEKEITLATPDHFGYLRTGLPHVVDDQTAAASEFSFKAQMKKPGVLFGNLDRIDFIKCDIEGYEEIVLPEMKDVLTTHKPLIQVETFGSHKQKVEDFLKSIGYEVWELEVNQLKRHENVLRPNTGDLLFVHPENNKRIKPFI